MPPQKNSRKQNRKEMRQQKKANRNAYYKSKYTSQLESPTKPEVGKKEAKNIIKNNSGVAQKKNKKVGVTNETGGGLQFLGVSDRMAQLQEYVNRESNKMTLEDSPKNKKSKEKKKSKEDEESKRRKSVQEAEVLEEQKRVRKYEKMVGFSRKKSGQVCEDFKADFGEILCDIEKGMLKDMNLYNSEQKEDLVQAVSKQNGQDNISVNHKTSIDSDDRDANTESDCTEDSFVVADDVVEYQERPRNRHRRISDTSSNASPKKAQNKKVTRYDSVTEGETDEESNCSGFFDDEAEECNESESDAECEDEMILFEGGSMQKNGSTCNGSQFTKHQNTMFDLYDVSSSDQNEDSYEKDDFVVSNSDDEKYQGKSIIKECLKVLDANQKKRRRIISMDDSDNENGSNCDTTNKRSRVYMSESSDSEGCSKKRKLHKKVNDHGNRRRMSSADSDEENVNIRKSKMQQRKKTTIDTDESHNNQLGDISDICSVSSATNTPKKDVEVFKEDIYGRLRDKRGNIVEAKSEIIYRTPAQYKLACLNKDKGEGNSLLKNKLKGMMNRLTDASMQGISNQVEGMYKKNSRNEMNDIITTLILDSIAKPEPVLNRLVQEFALLISILSANVGCEVGAHILTEFVIRWKDGVDSCHNSGADGDDSGSSECENLLAFISYLFLFRVVDSRLMFDILNYLSQNLHLMQVKLILRILRNVGFSLRKSDSICLKKFISDVQAKAELCAEKNYTRMQFLLEVFMALKNNNMSKIPEYDPSHGEQLKLVMKACLRQGCHHSDLKVSLTDLIKSKVVGRWWIVGSAWSDGLKETAVEEKESAFTKTNIAEGSSVYSEKFMRKAKKLHFTQPPRINIFYALTDGSEDGVECAQNILQLQINDSQTKEIFNVMVLCCQKGKQYNPFYAFTAESLCSTHRKYKGSLKLTLLDKFNQLPQMKTGYLLNLAKFTGALICKNAINMAVFKNIALQEPDDKTSSFLQQALTVILTNSSGVSVVEKVFTFLCCSPKLAVVKAEIRIFMKKHMPLSNSPDPQSKLLDARTKLALDILEKTDEVYM